MKRVILLSTLILMQTTVVHAGWMDSIKSRAKGIVDRKINETVDNTIDGAIDQATGNSDEQVASEAQAPVDNAPSASNKTEYNFGKLQADPFWFKAPKGSVKAIDVKIKGLRLGMPEMFADEALTKAGFTKQGLYSYVQIVKKDGQVVKRNNITWLSVEPSEEMIEELDAPVQKMVRKAQKLIEENNKKKEAERTARTDRRTRVRNTESDNIPNQLRLIYRITYNQSFNDSTRQDPMVMREQMVKLFGSPSYGFGKVSSHFISGAAFDMNMKTDLYYHDAAHISPKEKEALIKKAKVNEQKGVYDAFVHPCGSGAGGRCPGLAMSAAYPDNFDLELEASRIMHAPYMGIRIKGRLIETTLEWTYLQGEKGIRERHAQKKAYESAPTATVDF